MATMTRGGSAARLPRGSSEPRPSGRPTRCSVFAAVAVATALLPRVHACGLEPTINGGFQVSHPRALEVAVAVGNARRSGVLPSASADSASNEALLEQMLADLARLEAGRAVGAGQVPAPFSVVLVGPGLWSHFRVTEAGVVVSYHTVGPREGDVVVLTHHGVLQALLQGSLSPDRAEELGLLAFSGSDSAPVQRAFEIGFRRQS
jgi:hypothetical protein